MPRRVVRRPGPAGVGAQLDEPARDARAVEPVERLARQVGRQLDERELGPDLDRAEVVAAEAALVRERADDLPRLHPVPSADGDAVRRHRLGAGARTPLGALAPRALRTTAVAAVAAAAAVAVVAVESLALRPPRTLGLGLEQQRRLALRDDREGRRDVHLGHVVVPHVVGDDVAEALDALGLARAPR